MEQSDQDNVPPAENREPHFMPWQYFSLPVGMTSEVFGSQCFNHQVWVIVEGELHLLWRKEMGLGAIKSRGLELKIPKEKDFLQWW